MRIALLNPVTRDGTRTLRVGRCQGRVLVGLWPNIEYGYLAETLRRDPVRGPRREIFHLDANHAGLDFRAMLGRVAAWAPDLVFILGITASLADDLATAESLAIALPQARFVFWGTHATARPEDYLTEPRHLVLRREIDESGPELVRALEDGASRFEDVPGVSWRHGDELHHAPERPFVDDIDSLPLPSHGLIGTGTHRAADTHRPFALIKTSRGCPGACTFCTAHCFHGARWRARAPASVVEEIQWVHTETGVRDFFLQSDVFGWRRAWVVDLCERLLASDLDLTWFANSRVDTVDEELARLMRRAGCRLLSFGVESGADAVLAAVRKGTTRERSLEALGAVRRAGIPVLAYYVFGLDGETPETIAETFSHMRESRPDYAHFYTPTALPGSRLFEERDGAARLEEGLPLEEFFQGVSLEFLAPGLSRAEVERAITKAYVLFYADPRRVLRELGRLRRPSDLAGRARVLYDMARHYVVKR